MRVTLGCAGRSPPVSSPVSSLVGREDYSCKNLVIIPHDGVSGPSATGWTTLALGEPGCSGFDLGDVNADGRVDLAWQDDDNGDHDVRTWLRLGEPGGSSRPTSAASTSSAATAATTRSEIDR